VTDAPNTEPVDDVDDTDQLDPEPPATDAPAGDRAGSQDPEA
jgi:hypothetical protein